MPDLHWAENACVCDRPLHPNEGALCPECAFDVKEEQ